MKENGFINEFKKFIMRGNVMDMAVGVIVGGAFTAIVTSLNQDIPEPGYPDPNPWNLRRNREAVRCPHCTSILEDEAEKEAAATAEK